MKSSKPQSAELNRYLSEARNEAEGAVNALLAEGIEPTARRVKKRLQKRLAPAQETEDTPASYLTYCRSLLSTWRGRWKYQTMLAYQTSVNKLEAFAEKKEAKPLRFEKVTPDFCREIEEHLRVDLGNAANTRRKTLKVLKRFYQQAMKEDVIEWGYNPFDVLSMRKVSTTKDKLTTQELKALRSHELDEDTLLADVRRYFFFAFYAGGMRFADVAHLKRKHLNETHEGVRVGYRMGKTKNLHAVLLVDQGVDILDYYDWREKENSERIFPILDGYDLSTEETRRSAVGSQNALANKYLKKLARRAEVDKSISFHLSRHSTAGFLLEQGRSVRDIQKVLGHASLKQTEHYLKGFQSDGPDEASQSLTL